MKVLVSFVDGIPVPPPRRVVLEMSIEEAQALRAALGSFAGGETSPIYEALYDEIEPGPFRVIEHPLSHNPKVTR